MIEKTYNICGIQKMAFLSRIKRNGKIHYAIIEPITAEQEKSIDDSAKFYGEIRYKNSHNEIITAKNIYMYGEIDFNSDEDLDCIERFNLIDEGWNPNFIPSTFDYNTGLYTTIEGKLKGAPTFNCIEWLKYCHVLIGKPERIIVYNITV